MFQSYLIYGAHPENLRKKTTEIARQKNVKIGTSSPDCYLITPEKKSITIEQIRNLKAHIAQKPLKYKYKLVIIEQAHLATHEAQNALLKTLEEPPIHAIIILEAKNYKSFLPTILSRVVKIKATEPKKISSDHFSLQPTEVALIHINEINPQQFLDDQIISLTKKLTTAIVANQPSQKLAAAIEKCLETKKMIDANVNPKFALANLIFHLNLTSKELTSAS